MNRFDTTYLEACRDILNNGRLSTDRTGVGTKKITGIQMRFDMRRQFPLLTTKKLPAKMISDELEFFLRGETNNQWLNDRGCHIWDAFVGDDKELGPIYGAQWRAWRGEGVGVEVDQVGELIENLRKNPMSRRHIVSGWNPALLPVEGRKHAENVNAGLQALPPCHALWQVHCVELTVEERRELCEDMGIQFGASQADDEITEVADNNGIPKHGASLQLYQRSADMFLGVPFNIASYGMLLLRICRMVNMTPMEFIWSGGDCHIYTNHFSQVREQISRLEDAPDSPTLRIRDDVFVTDLSDFTWDDFILENYNPMPHIKGEMAV